MVVRYRNKGENVPVITEEQTNVIIVASHAHLHTGINIRNLYNVVFASPRISYTSAPIHRRGCVNQIKVVHTSLLDIADDLHIKTENFTLNHFLERINIYNEEELDYEIEDSDMMDNTTL